jgi:hypothetical protein
MMQLWNNFQEDPFQKYFLGGGNTKETWEMHAGEFETLVKMFIRHTFLWLRDQGFLGKNEDWLNWFMDKKLSRYCVYRNLSPRGLYVTSPYEVKIIILDIQKQLFKETQDEPMGTREALHSARGSEEQDV